MIICHDKKFIFLKTHKVGGTSLEIALSRMCNENDVITRISTVDEATRSNLGYQGPVNYEPTGLQKILPARVSRFVPFGRPRLKHHELARTLKPLFQDIWDDYFKFSVVRNPFDFAISAYFWTLHRSESGMKATSLDGFDDVPPIDEYFIQNPKILHRNRAVYQLDGKDCVDLMVRYEHLEHDLALFDQHIDAPDVTFDHMKKLKAKGGIRPKKANTAAILEEFPRLYELISKECSVEIEKFGYAPE